MVAIHKYWKTYSVSLWWNIEELSWCIIFNSMIWFLGQSKTNIYFYSAYQERLTYMELLYADDLVLIAETKELLLEKVRKWKTGMEKEAWEWILER